MKESNQKTILVLTLIIAVLSALFVLALTGEISLESSSKTIEDKIPEQEEITPEEKSNSENKEKQYTYDEIAGLYTKEEKITIDNEEEQERTDLLLNEDGTYFFSYAVRISQRHAGNYIINGNKIVLNKLFQVSDGPGVIPSFETITIEINQGKIIYTNKKSAEGNTKTVELTKNSNLERDKFVRVYGADKETILKNSYYHNNKDE